MSLTLTLKRGTGNGTVSGSGTNIELDGTIAGGAIESVEMYGDTEQQTYSGKNKLSFSNVTSSQVTGTNNGDGTITISGTANASGGFAIGRTNVAIPAGTYTLSISRPLSYALNLSFASGVACRIAAGDTYATVTLPESYDATDLFMAMTSGTTYNDTFGIQLVQGSTADYNFEPYVGGTASPNPDYPQEVQTVTGRQVVTISDGQGNTQTYEANLGKNLLDKSSETASLEAYFNVGNVSLNPNTRMAYIPCLPNTTYTVSRISGKRFAVATTSVLPDVGVAVSGYINDNTGTSITITTNSSAKYLCVFYYLSTTDTLTPQEILDTLQIERGSTATDYAPYFTPIELCKIGDYQDYIYKSGDDWYVHKATSVWDIDGTESWNMPNTSSYPHLFQTASISLGLADSYTSSEYGPGLYCAYLVQKLGGGTDGENVRTTQGIALYKSGTSEYCRLNQAALTTMEQFQTWVSNNDVSVYYALATPTDTKITDSTLIGQLNALNAGDTYDGTTIITVTSENLASPLEVKVSTNIAKTYTEVEIGSPFTVTDVEGKSSNTTLDGNVYVDWAYNKKQYTFDLFNLTPQDYAEIRAFYDYQFNNSSFPTITVPELGIERLPVYMEISSRNIVNQCLLTDKLTIKFRETIQP